MDILKKVAVFAAGTLFGTAGIKVLSSRDAKKVYANCTAAVLRAKDCVMDTVTTCLLYTSSDHCPVELDFQ